MPTTYTTAVTVDGYASADYGSQLDSLEIVSGSTSPYELPQPPSARASFLGLPVVSGVTQTPDWWIGKKVTFTITPQGATGTVSWAGIVQGYTCEPVQTSSTDQIVELHLLGQTSRLSTEIIQNGQWVIPGAPNWTYFIPYLQGEINKSTWAEVPAGLTWAGTAGNWAAYNNNKSGLTFAYDTITAGSPSAGTNYVPTSDFLSAINEVWGNKYRGWYWFDDTTITFNATTYTNYTQISTLDATSCVLWSSLSSSQDFSNIINSATIADDEGLDPVSYLDGTSYDAYGYRFNDFGNSLESSTATRTLVITDKVNAYKNPNKYLQSFTVNLDALTHTAGEWQNYYKSTKPVRIPITNIPTAYGGNHTYLVRGVQLSLTRRHAEATLIVVPETIYNPS